MSKQTNACGSFIESSEGLKQAVPGVCAPDLQGIIEPQQAVSTFCAMTHAVSAAQTEVLPEKSDIKSTMT